MIVSEAELVAAATRDYAAGLRVGFARVSFDLFAVQIVRLLQHSVAGSDRLAVAVIDKDRAPIISVRDQAELVDGLRGVSYVTVCTEGAADRLAAVIGFYVS